MAMTLTATNLDPTIHFNQTYTVPNLLLRELSDLPLRGDEGARDLLFPEAFDEDPSTDLTEEEFLQLLEHSAGLGYLESEVVRETDRFELALNTENTNPLSKGARSFVDLSIKYTGRDFEYGTDALGPVLPIDGTIETIDLTITTGVSTRVRGVPADIEVTATGLDLDITPTLFDSTDTFLKKLLQGDQTLEFSPYLITSFAGDGRDLVGEVTARGGNDFIRLTEDDRDERMVGANLHFAGDFLTVNAGATLNGGSDTFTGSFPATFLGGTEPGVFVAAPGVISGDVIDALGVVNGGNDALNFTDSLTAAAGLFGDAQTASGTVIGGRDEIVGTGFDDVLVGDVGTAKAGSAVTGGNDTIFGLGGDDLLIGDVRTTKDGATVTGGNDRLFGGKGDDRLEGGGGDDDLDGGAGRDVMLGGDGDDFMIINAASDVEAGEVYFGGADTDDFILFASGLVDLREVDIIGMEGLRFGSAKGSQVALLSSQIIGGGFDPDSLIKVFAPDGVVEKLVVDVDNGSVDLSALQFRKWERGTDKVVVNGSSAADTITGSVQNDTLNGNGGSDELDGARGRDTLIGGTGSDIYHYNGGDRIIEKAGEGFDQIIASRNLRDMADNVEHATLAEVATATVVKGNGEDNLIEGNSFDNRLFGNAGADSIFGVGGANLLSGGDGGDLITGAEGDDTILGGKGDDFLDGGRGDDVIKGNVGADDAFGGDGDDRLLGGGGDDILGGGNGDDTLLGGAGDDDLSGDAGADKLEGGANDDTLAGGAGADVLTGGFGADRFVFRDTDGPAVDEITDFRRADTIVLEGAGFGLTAGVLSEEAFAFVPGAAATADTRIIYDGTTGALFFDADGSGAGTAVQLAQLEVGLALRADDFLVVL